MLNERLSEKGVLCIIWHVVFRCVKQCPMYTFCFLVFKILCMQMKLTVFPGDVLRSLFFWTANRWTVYSAQSQSQIPQNLSCLSFKSTENSVGAVIWEEIVYIVYYPINQERDVMLLCIVLKYLACLSGSWEAPQSLDKPITHRIVLKTKTCSEIFNTDAIKLSVFYVRLIQAAKSKNSSCPCSCDLWPVCQALKASKFGKQELILNS